MKYITYEDYITCLKLRRNFSFLIEENEEYIIDAHEDEIDKIHDKMFRSLLSKKTEMEKLLRQFLKMEEISADDLIQCHTDYVTRKYKNTLPDIVYRLQNKPVYFLVEHQSKVDEEMPERIFDYVHEIMRDYIRNLSKENEKVLPIVVPIVIYTGFSRWRAKTNLANKQYQTEEYKQYLMHLKYNLIEIQDYGFEELLDFKSLVGVAMILEKCRTAKELEEQTYKIIETMTEQKDELKDIIMNFVSRSVGIEKANEMIQKMNEKEEKGMSPLTKMLVELKVNSLNEGLAKGKKEGLREGMIRGIREGMRDGMQAGELTEKIQTIKNMLKGGETEEKIMKYTEITKEELERFKKEIEL